MTRVQQLAQRAKRQYIKPEFPPGPFILISPEGWEDGLFYAEHLRQTSFPGKPWAFSGLGGSPKVFRATKQKDNKLHCEDGIFTIVSVPPERMITPGWTR